MKFINKLIAYLQVIPYIIARDNELPELTIVTGSDSSHYKSLDRLLHSICENEPKSNIIVYDLGLNEEELSDIKIKYPEVEIKEFVFSIYPDHFNIRVNAGEYAWKPVIISETLVTKKGCVCWMDAGNLLTSKLHILRRITKKIGMYSPHSSGNVKEWTHPLMLEYYKCDEAILKKTNLNGACISIDSNNIMAMDIINEWRRCALVRVCIAPPGSDRRNHRQDQSALSILAHKSGITNKMPSRKYGFKTHQDIDE